MRRRCERSFDRNKIWGDDVGMECMKEGLLKNGRDFWNKRGG